MSFFCKLSCVCVLRLPFFNQDEVTNACIAVHQSAKPKSKSEVATVVTMFSVVAACGRFVSEQDR